MLLLYIIVRSKQSKFQQVVYVYLLYIIHHAAVSVLLYELSIIYETKEERVALIKFYMQRDIISCSRMTTGTVQ